MPNPPSFTTAASKGFANWLRRCGISLAFTTYRANRLLFLGTDLAEPAQLKLHERLFDRPMGLFVDGESLWMAARCQLWRLDNLLAPGHLHEGGDRLFVPAASFTTGDVNAHELVIGADNQPIFVNTAFSCLATIKPRCSFAPPGLLPSSPNWPVTIAATSTVLPSKTASPPGRPPAAAAGILRHGATNAVEAVW